MNLVKALFATKKFVIGSIRGSDGYFLSIKNRMATEKLIAINLIFLSFGLVKYF